MTKYVGVLTLFSLVTVSQAAEPAWVSVTTELLQREKTGFGGLCGVVVDHGSGDVLVNLSDRGMFRSTDQGKTWKRVSERQPKGRTETPGCWLLDPTGKSQRMVTALVYGAPISASSDRAATWKSMHHASSHVDWCAVDWTDPDLRFVLALKHEAGGLLLASRDGGQSFVEVGKGYGPGYVFDNQTAIVAEVQDNKPPRLLRTTDGGRTFQPCGDFSPVGKNSAQVLPKWRDGTLYWLVEDGLIATADKGKTWMQLSLVKDAQYGPIFGRSAKHMFLLTKAGPVESTDGGLTWSSPLAPPQEMKGIGGLSWLDYDPQHDRLYLMKMGSDLYRLTRAADPHDTTSVQGNWTPVKAELGGRLVSPQCPGDDSWSKPTQQKRLVELLDHIVKSYSIDEDRICLTGLSMGGYGSWRMAADHPERFSCAVPVCGGGDPADAEDLKDLPIWGFHGDQDGAVPFERSVEMVEAIKKAGGTKIRFTLLEHIGHNCWSAAYATPELFDWIRKQTRTR